MTQLCHDGPSSGPYVDHMSLLSRRSARRAADDDALQELRAPQVVEDGRLVGSRKSAAGRSLRGVDLRNADLRWADLSRCNLRGADLSGARLSGADLCWANLSNANLTEADLRSTRLVETVFDGADLTETGLSTATGLTWATVQHVRGGKTITWPPGFVPGRPPLTAPSVGHLNY